MPNAFPPKPGCPVPVVPAIEGTLAPFDILCVPPDPIFEFPAFEFPLPEPPGFNFGCYEPSLEVDFAQGSPSFSIDRTYPDESETGKCAPNLKFTVRIPAGGGGGNATVRVVSVDNQALSGVPSSIDCVAVAVDDTVLCIGQTDPAENGMYKIKSGTWERTTDTVSPGMIVTVRDGFLYPGSTWQLNTEGPITPDTTPLTFDKSGRCCCEARVATTTNVTTSGLQTIDGISVADGDIVLVKDQTNPIENGPYAASSGAWDPQVCVYSPGMLVTVREGSTYSGTAFILATEGPLSCENTTEYIFVPLRAPGNVTVRSTFIGNVTRSGVQSPDGITGAAGMLVLVKDNTTQSENGIYVMQAGAWTRTTDLLVEGMIVTAREGIRYRGTVFTLITNGPIVVDTTSLIFVPGQRTIVPCDGATTLNVGSLSGIQSIDGVVGFAGRVVLVKNQTTTSSNGVYVMQTGAWGRTSDVLRQHMLVSVLFGTVNSRTLWIVNANTPTFQGVGAFFR
jgi:hypothetical protein